VTDFVLLGLLFAQAPVVATPSRDAYAQKNADIVITKAIPAPAATVYAYLLDLKHEPDLWTPDCAGSWSFGNVTRGLGATGHVRYTAAEWSRTLDMVLSKVQENFRIEIEHTGKKGFTTTWTLRDQGLSTSVELHTWLNAPPWPFRRFYFRKVQPAWTSCHARVLENLERVMKSSEGAPAPAAG
jgi:hypothetical protein